MLADAGFDAGPVFEQAEQAGLQAMIRLKRRGTVRHPRRRQAEERFDRQVYRLRLIAQFAKTAQNRNKLRKTLRSLCSQRFESAVCAQQGD